MSFREKLQNGTGRWGVSIGATLLVAGASFYLWPTVSTEEERLLSGLQKVAFVGGAFAVTAYNLRTRVVDLVLKIEGKPNRVREFCRIARHCGARLTNLVVLFTLTSVLMAALTALKEGTLPAKAAGAVSLGMFACSVVSFLYIVFAFERLERFALDEAEETAARKEADRLFPVKPESDEDIQGKL